MSESFLTTLQPVLRRCTNRGRQLRYLRYLQLSKIQNALHRFNLLGYGSGTGTPSLEQTPIPLQRQRRHPWCMASS